MDIYVDADACPVKQEILKVAGRHNAMVYLVSNQWLRDGADPLVTAIVVPAEPDAADDWIADHIGPRDLVITSDIPLADRCIKKDAYALAPDGSAFTKDSIGMALAMRDLKSQLRDAGQLEAGGRPFQKSDRSRFLVSMENFLQKHRSATN